jgi:hypothetical protein
VDRRWQRTEHGDAAKIAVEVPIERGEPHFDDPQSRRHASAALSKPDRHG